MLTEGSVVLSTVDGVGFAQHRYDRQKTHQLLSRFVIRVAAKTLEHFSKDYISHS